MADQPDPIEANIREFLGLTSMSLDGFREDFRAIVTELEAVRKSMDTLATDTLNAARASQELASWYEKGHSEQASRPTGDSSTAGMGASAGASVGAAEENAARQAALEMGLISQRTETGWVGAVRRAASINTGGFGPSSAASVANQRVGEYFANRQASGQYQAGMTPAESLASMAQALGVRGGAGGGVPNAAPPQMPQFGEFTTQNLIQYMSDMATHRGLRRYASNGLDTGTEAWANIGRALQGAADFAPKVAMAHQFARSYGYDMRSHSRDGLGGLEGLGERYGQSGADGFGTINLPFGLGGIRLPFINPAAREGVMAEIKKTWEARQAGINKEQLNTIESNMLDRGYYDRGGAQWRAAIDMARTGNKQVAMSSQYYDAMDKATRAAGVSLRTFNDTMKKVPETAKAAKVSFEQMMADMDAMGDLNQQQGGMFNRGQQTALGFATVTGLAPGPFVAAQNNPLVQAELMRTTGLAPFMQGLATPGQRVNSTLAAVQQISGVMRTTAPNRGGFKGFNGENLKSNISDEDASIAAMKLVMPEFSPEYLKMMLNPESRKSMEMSGQLLEVGQDMAADTAALEARAKKGDARAARMLRDMAKNRGKRDGVTSQGELAAMMRQAQWVNPYTGEVDKISKGEMEDIMGAGKGKSQAERAKAQAAALEKVISAKNAKIQPDSQDDQAKYIVELGPNAQKLLRLVPKDEQKTQANAGRGTTNRGAVEPTYGVTGPRP